MLTVREVDLRSELGMLADVFNKGFRLAIPQSRFDWLYCRNPDGPATAWFVGDDRNGEIAGCTAVFPRRIQVRGQRRPVEAWNCGDFTVLPRYRAGGAAIRLRRAAREGVDSGAKPFLYAHPNDRMLQIHLRVGHQPLGRMLRLARPTRVKNGHLTGRIATAGIRAIRPDRWLGRRDEWTLAAAFTGGVDDLFDRLRLQLGTMLVRDVRYLTWRFLECPLQEHRIVLASRGNSLTGYLVFSIANDQLHVKDWLGQDRRAVRTLFSAVLDEACAADVASASVTLLETHPDRDAIRALGFATRPDSSTSITYAPASLPWRGDVMSPEAWYMTVGDRDV
jgi:hypothetical protein